MSRYDTIYDRIPKDFGGLLLKYATKDLTATDEIDDIIVEAYAESNDQLLLDKVKELLNNYRKKLTEEIMEDLK